MLPRQHAGRHLVWRLRQEMRRHQGSDSRRQGIPQLGGGGGVREESGPAFPQPHKEELQGDRGKFDAEIRGGAPEPRRDPIQKGQIREEMAVFLQGHRPRGQRGIRLGGPGQEIGGIRRQRAEGEEGILRHDGAGERPRDVGGAGIRRLFGEMGDRNRYALLQARVRIRRDQGPQRLFRLRQRVLRLPLDGPDVQAAEGLRVVGGIREVHIRQANKEA